MDVHQQLRELKYAAPFVGVYSMFWACVYLYVFWSSFNINPFPYVGGSEIFTLSALFLFQSSVFAIFILISQALMSSTDDAGKEKSEVEGLRLRAMIVISVCSVSFFFMKEYPFLAAVVIGVTMPIVTPLSYVEILRHSFSSKPIRVAVSALIVSLPLFSIVAAKTEADQIITGKGRLTMIRAESNVCMLGCILIGKLGGYFSVVGANGKVIMVKTERIQVFELYEGSGERVFGQVAVDLQ